jgi:uncharacterized RDD family membrane protein YckC
VVEVERPLVIGEEPTPGVEEEDFDVNRLTLPEELQKREEVGQVSTSSPPPFVYAGVGRRVVAVLVDSLIVVALAVLAMVLAVLAALVGGTAAGEVTRQVKFLALGASPLAGFAVSLVYHLLCWGQGGQTLGKMLMGIRVVGREGEEIGYRRAFVRWVGYLLALLPLGAGFLMITFHPRRRGLHDLLAGTCVIQVSPRGGRGDEG